MKQREEFLKQMRNKLLAKRADLSRLLEDISREATSDGQVKDSADEAHESLMSKLQVSIEEAELNEIKQIDDALERVERGEYGICVQCSEPISSKRLEIYPYAPRCISCQESLEG